MAGLAPRGFPSGPRARSELSLRRGSATSSGRPTRRRGTCDGRRAGLGAADLEPGDVALPPVARSAAVEAAARFMASSSAPRRAHLRLSVPGPSSALPLRPIADPDAALARPRRAFTAGFGGPSPCRVVVAPSRAPAREAPPELRWTAFVERFDPRRGGPL